MQMDGKRAGLWDNIMFCVLLKREYTALVRGGMQSFTVQSKALSTAM